MSPSHPVQEVVPVCRVPAFADSVRARVRPSVSATNPLRLSVARPRQESNARRPSALERVFRRPPAAAARVRTTGVGSGLARLDAHLHVRVSTERRLETRTVWRRKAALPTSGGRRGTTPAPTTTPTRETVLRTVSRVLREGPLPVSRATAAATTPRPGPAAAPRPAARVQAPAGPPQVPQVHRTSPTLTPQTGAPHSVKAAAPVRVLAHWDGEARTGAVPPGLTASDLPVVVDHVVREIDRRVVAARERRGWTP